MANLMTQYITSRFDKEAATVRKQSEEVEKLLDRAFEVYKLDKETEIAEIRAEAAGGGGGGKW